MRYIVNTIIALMLLAVTPGCGAKEKTTASDTAPAFEEQGSFSADSAYAYVAAQTAFGPRVPGSDAHRACADWIEASLRSFGADTVYSCGTPVEAWDGTTLPVRNIFASFNSQAPARILLLAHYDTRPWADHDPDPDARLNPIDGANDGASGVAVLLEIARNLQLQAPGIGVDILMADVEDYGARDDAGIADSSDTWCLGTQQFAAALPYTAATMPRYGILLDMVGGRGARFSREYISSQYAPMPTARVWGMAAKMGLSDRFPQAIGGAVTDDHLPLIRAGIPTTDIIECGNADTGTFNPSWHTHADNLENIDPATLGAVGRVVLNVIYNEKP